MRTNDRGFSVKDTNSFFLDTFFSRMLNEAMSNELSVAVSITVFPKGSAVHREWTRKRWDVRDGPIEEEAEKEEEKRKAENPDLPWEVGEERGRERGA